MGFATADVAGLDVDGCLLCHKFTLFGFHNGLLGQSLIGGCRERVTSCSGFLGVEATERSFQREGHSLVGLHRADSPCRVLRAAS